MRRISSNINLILVLIFIGIMFFNPFILTREVSAQPSEPNPVNPFPYNNIDAIENDLMKSRAIHPRSDDLVSMGQDRIIERDEVIESNVVVIGADLTVYGRINGDAVCIGGDLTVGPQGVIKGNIVNVGGTLDVDPSARTYKDRVNVQDPFGFLKGISGMDVQKLGGKINLVAKILRIVMDCVYILLIMFFALLLTTFMSQQFNSVEEKLSKEFPKCVLLGVASMIGVPIIIIGFIITVIGIMAVPFLLLACVLCSLTGYIVFSRMLGRRLLPEKNIILQIMAGVLLLHGLLVIGDLFLLQGGAIPSAIGHVFRSVGAIIIISVNFIGLGAVIYSLLARRKTLESPISQPDRFPNSSGNGDAI